MFGELKVGVKNLLTKANSWSQNQTFTRLNQGSTPQSQILLTNTTTAAAGAQQTSPAVEWAGQGWKTNSVAASQPVSFRASTLPVQSTSSPIGSWRLDGSVNGGAWTNYLEVLTTAVDGVAFPRLNVNGALKVAVNNSSTIDTLQSLDLVNPSGSRINLTYTFGSTIKAGIQVQDSGAVYYKSAGAGTTHYFQCGPNISSAFDVVQIYGGGIYNYGGMFATGNVTAGQSDTAPPATLNTFGSLAVRGTLKLANATLGTGETFVYCDAANANICAGTATACSTHTGSGQAVCESHAPVGCSWTAAVTGNCSTATGTDSGTCTGLNAACTWETSSCSSANNTDSTTCDNLNAAYGGTCSWDVSTCSGQTSTAACSGVTGCTPDVTGDCTTLSDGGGDGTNCATQPECSYDSGTGACTGTHFVACTGNLCGGTYNTGNCTGTYTITPAACTGTASCGNITTSGACATEGGGCSWVSGMTITLPPSSAANDGNTSRLYSIVNIGSTGTITVVADASDSILGYGSGVVLNAQNERVMLHHHIVYANCSQYSANQAVCESTSGCSYAAAVTCSTYNGDESGCNAQSGAGCSYDSGTSTCSGAGSAASCSGTFISSKPWVIHQLSN